MKNQTAINFSVRVSHNTGVKLLALGLAGILCLWAEGVYAQGKWGGQSGQSGQGGQGGYGGDSSKLKVGDDALDFTLKGLDGASVTLSSFEGKKPVFLIFGSYT